MSEEESARYWAYIKRTANEVKKWPDWLRGSVPTMDAWATAHLAALSPDQRAALRRALGEET